jgi:glycosyltransferase involved in cell wall biosynthesis
MGDRLLCVHQGWELYGSDRSFLLNLELIKSERPDLILCAVVPKMGLIIEPIAAIVHEVLVEDVGAVALRSAKRNPLVAIFKVLRATRQALRRARDADAVYINTIVPFGYLLASIFSQKVVIVHVREIPTPLMAKIFAFWFRVIGAYLIFNSQATCLAFGLGEYARGKVILNAVEEINTNDYGFSNHSSLNLLIIGRINAWKGHLLLLEAVASLGREDRRRIKIRVVGSPPDRQSDFMEELLVKIELLGLLDTVDLFAFNSNPSEHFCWSNIVVVPSILPEPFGRVAAEAMSAGRAVIAANHGGLAEIVVHGKTGWLFEPGDVASLREVIHDALGNLERVRLFGVLGKKVYQAKFTPEAYKKEFLFLLNSILPTKAKQSV